MTAAVPASPAMSNKKNASLQSISDTQPSETQLDYAADDFVYNSKGKKVPFKDIITSKTLVIFIRHFRCALCQDFLMYITFNGQLTSERLSKMGTDLVVVGCGGWRYIKEYQKLLNLPYPVFANPSTSIYKSLRMGNFYGIDKNVKSHYTAKGWYNMVWRSIIKGLRMGHFFSSPGDSSQLGGEFILSRDQTGKLHSLFSHRMKTIADHSTAEALLNALELQPDPPSPQMDNDHASN